MEGSIYSVIPHWGGGNVTIFGDLWPTGELVRSRFKERPWLKKEVEMIENDTCHQLLASICRCAHATLTPTRNTQIRQSLGTMVEVSVQHPNLLFYFGHFTLNSGCFYDFKSAKSGKGHRTMPRVECANGWDRECVCLFSFESRSRSWNKAWKLEFLSQTEPGAQWRSQRG